MNKTVTYSYFPGCSLSTSARENNESLIASLKALGIQLEELEDWNCCGSSSAHSIDAGLAFDLSARNLSLAPFKTPLLVACPGCYLRLKSAHLHLMADPGARETYESSWERKFDPDLRVIHLFELLSSSSLLDFHGESSGLNKLRIAPYYGCMLAHPPALRRSHRFYGLMESVITSLGGTPVEWSHAAKCCGTFLTVARPDIATPMIEQIIDSAAIEEAECIVTACAI